MASEVATTDQQDQSPDQDDWHSVTDAKKRKQIQDRLAQRARRKRLREAAERDKLQQQSLAVTLRPTIKNTVCAQAEAEYNDMSCTLLALDGDGLHGTDFTGNFTGGQFSMSPASTSPSEDNSRSVVIKPPDQGAKQPITIAIPFHLTPVMAWFINSQVLRLPACNGQPMKSKPCDPSFPAALHPTTTQLLIPHSTGIDGFPFPKFRDNYINLCGVCLDEEEFTRDLYLAPSFKIVPGGMPWDPAAWTIEPSFAQKYGFLFSEMT